MFELDERSREPLLRVAAIRPGSQLFHLGNQLVDCVLAIKLGIVTPRRRKVAAFDKLQSRASEPASRTITRRPPRKRSRSAPRILASRPSSKDSPNGLARVGKLSLEPAIEGHLEQRLRCVIGSNFEQRVDAGLDRALTQQIATE